ncbi:MAG: DEAD/DEAH box helicase [Deltaproteobacteria bacterium]|nr:DEAD/DEAH box helicase [Deltaproteobacteria bacterium]
MNDVDPSQTFEADSALADLPIAPELAAALEERGYTTLTPVQEAVLEPSLAGRDLRVSSQTGSGKTVAIGFAVRDVVASGEPQPKSAPNATPTPRVLVIVPTRELAKQVELELAWLFAGLRVGVTSVAGGANYSHEHRALSKNPAVVVGTPGRLLDHLQRGSIDASRLGAVVLDEADRMFDMGFQEDLESIFGFAPSERRTHLVSATFPREVLHLADRVQRAPVRVEATPLGVANADIEHVAHFVAPDRRLDALVNLLLSIPEERTLVFAKTRADVSDVTDALAGSGFHVAALSGEMEQRERNRAIEGFKLGRVTILVATDVAARGIDVQNVAQVIHLEPPTDADTYTHRSGRTGRAGNKGRSVMLVTPGDMYRAQRVVRQTRVPARFAPLPAVEALHAAQADRVVARLTARPEGEVHEAPLEPRTRALVERLIAAGDLERTLARLVGESGIARGPVPRDVVALPLPNERPTRPREPRRAPGGYDDSPRAPRQVERNQAPFAREDEGRPPRTLPPSGWVGFRVTWGAAHGADVRRLLAMVCRRGGITSGDVGRIHVGRYASEIEVASEAASSFEAAARQPDPRDARVRIERNHGGDGVPSAPRAPRAPRFDGPRARQDEGPPVRAQRPRQDEGAPARAPRPRQDDDAPARAPRPSRKGAAPPVRGGGAAPSRGTPPAKPRRGR